jgi:hypothetical protein
VIYYYKINYKAHDAKEDVMTMMQIFKNMNLSESDIIKRGNYAQLEGLSGEGLESDETSLFRRQ